MYNGEKYIEDCYKCLENQTYKNLEIIFINDGSKDNTKHLLDDLAEKDDRVVVIHKENGGVSSARNAGLDIAKGEYISFYDVDDQLDKRFFEVLLNDIFKYDVDIAMCQQITWVKQENSYSLSEGWLDIAGNVISDANIMWKYYYENYDHKGSAKIAVVWGKLFNKSIIGNIRFNCNMTYAEDLLFMFSIFSNKPKIFIDLYKGYIQIRWSDSAIGSIKSNFQKKIKCSSDMSKFFIENYALCCSCCNEETVEVVKKWTKKRVHEIIYFLVRSNEKIYYKSQKIILKELAKVGQKNNSLSAKIYLKLYLFNSSICWTVSRCIAFMQRLKAK